jgi:penicillin G amidase
VRRVPRWLIFTAIVVVVTLGALTSVVVGTVRSSFPQLDGEIAVPGLQASVEVLRDEYGVPQIYADQAEDLFQAQGFVHAQDRFFEMDVRRHVTAGRLSELFGASQVGTDTYIRTLGWRRVAEQELGLLSASARRYLDAYAAGVNAYVRSRSPGDLSLEYSLLAMQGRNYRPADWTAVDSLSWLKAMAWDLGSNMRSEIETARISARVGRDRASELRPDYPLHDFEPIVETGALRDRAFDPSASPGSARTAPAGLAGGQVAAVDAALRAAGRGAAAIPPLLGDAAKSALGSNSWVVHGTRTETGKPILANDPHLATSIPSIFAQVGLHCREVTRHCPFDVSGFSFAGLPGIVIGKNTEIAWGLTTSYADVQDLYLEQLREDSVRDGDRYVPLQVRTEEIRVAGEEQPRKITIRSSRHGPLLSDADPGLADVGTTPRGNEPGPFAVALAWTALTPNRTMDALFQLNTARNFTEFRAGAELLAAPSQNLVYADRDGNIGYQLPGALPVRGEGDGVRPSPGWDRSYDWRGTIPFEQLPHSYNPSSGYIVTANNQVIGDRYPYRIGSDYSYGWRSQEIIDTLERSSRLTIADSARLQVDDTTRAAADLVPTLLKVKIPDPWVVEGQRTLVGWDYNSSAESPAAAYFFVVVHHILKRTFRDELPEELWPATTDRFYAVISELIKDPDNRWWDDKNTPTAERRDDILVGAMTDARKELTTTISRDTDGWAWGKIHRVHLRHQTLGKSGVAAIERLFNRGDFAAAGAGGVVNAMGYDDRVGFDVTTGATMRMTVDLADLDRSVWVNQTGVSGHAYAGHYDDQTQLWATNQTWPFVSSRAAVDARTRSRLTLNPSG